MCPALHMSCQCEHRGQGSDRLAAVAWCRSAAGDAISKVELPEAVIDVLTGLRNWLQDKAEPPVYVSDRRFMKAINMLQVVAHADGREQVSRVQCQQLAMHALF